jgi:fumarate hydratase class II
MKTDSRTEYDTLGKVKVPAQALYGAQTQRAVQNFTISEKTMPAAFIKALLLIKQGAASANRQLDLLDGEKAAAIILAATGLRDRYRQEHFPVPVLQTGSGTSTNMNVNEVIARACCEAGVEVLANDHVNMGQSSNDVIPSAIHLAAALAIDRSVIPAIKRLAATIRERAREHRTVIKTGRTHLMDALPVKLEQEMNCWASMLDDDSSRLNAVLKRLQLLPLGGTAVGSGVNCHPDFPAIALQAINESTGMRFRSMSSAYKGISCIDTILEGSGHLKTTGVTLMKIANDLRWMNSGPQNGLGEIRLEPLQPGSSIMPDKVNPVIPEAVCMAVAAVIGNDSTLTIAAQSGNFQLNTMLPLAADKLLESIELIGKSAVSLAEKAIETMVIETERMAASLNENPILVTALAPYIGYDKAAAIAQRARSEGRRVVEVAAEMTELDPRLLKKLLDPRHLASGGR